MGGIGPAIHDFPSIAFAKKESALSSDDQLSLVMVAEHLKQNPEITIKLVAYGKGVAGTKRATQKLKLIRNYLVMSMGISGERVKQQIEKISGVKLVDIMQVEE